MTREFTLAFLVSFGFFFIIFFVNSILLLIQKIMLKNITMDVMAEMVLLSMPQFLIYIFPFATLSGASMTLGDMNSNNELLAMRASGVSLSRVFRPILISALMLSLCTYLVSDFLLPWSHVQYKERLATLMREMPTFELESNGVNSISNIIISNGETEGDRITDLAMMNTDRSSFNTAVSAPAGTVRLVDPINFVYELTVEQPSMLLTDSADPSTYIVAEAESAKFYLDFSKQVPTLTNTNPVNLSSRELIDAIRKRKVQIEADRKSNREYIDRQIEHHVEDYRREHDGKEPDPEELKAVRKRLQMENPVRADFYSIYYKAELSKKLALSLACFFLVLVALPLGLLKVRYGKLTGFAISLLVAVVYWYMLFYAQMRIFDSSVSPYILMFAPDIAIGALGCLLLAAMRKDR